MPTVDASRLIKTWKGDSPNKKLFGSRNGLFDYVPLSDVVLTVGGGSGNLDNDINVTNDDGAFTHLASTIPEGTSIETLLRDILNPYVTTTVNLSSMSIAIKASGTYGSFNPVSTNLTLEAGQECKINQFSYLIGTPSVTEDNTVKFFRNNSPVLSNLLDTNVSHTFPEALILLLNNSTGLGPSGSTNTFKVQAVDTGSGSSVNVDSNIRSVSFLDRVRIGASSYSGASPSNAGDIFGELNVYNQLKTRQDISVQGDSNTDSVDNYTWIVCPQSWGGVNDILLASFSVLPDFQPAVIQPVTNAHGAVINYSFYRSNSKGAFGVGQNITVKF